VSFFWYEEHAGIEVAERFRRAVTATLELLGISPEMGPFCGIKDDRLASLRFFPLNSPFDKLLIFYRLENEKIIATRLMHGARDLPRRLKE
jgi:plasmid stabilization system protein ParE